MVNWDLVLDWNESVNTQDSPGLGLVTTGGGHNRQLGPSQLNSWGTRITEE